nr:DNA polymerase III subunit delta [Sphingomicrobium sediminis]
MLDPNGLKSDPGKLVDEAAGAGLFGDKKILWIEPVGNEFHPAAEALLGAPATEHPVIAIAGNLTRASKLLKLIEPHQEAISVISYAPSARDIERDIEQMLGEEGLRAEAGVAQRLAASCDLNRMIARREIEKAKLYVGEGSLLDHEVLDAIGADYGETQWLAVGDAAMDGDLDAVEQALCALSPQASEATPLLRALQRRIQQLAPMSARIAGGERLDQVIASQGKVLFWKDKPLIQRLLRRWSAPALARLAERVADAERKVMLEPGARRAALGEELLAIARASRRMAR